MASSPDYGVCYREIDDVPPQKAPIRHQISRSCPTLLSVGEARSYSGAQSLCVPFKPATVVPSR